MKNYLIWIHYHVNEVEYNWPFRDKEKEQHRHLLKLIYADNEAHAMQKASDYILKRNPDAFNITFENATIE